MKKNENDQNEASDAEKKLIALKVLLFRSIVPVPSTTINKTALSIILKEG